MFSLQNGTIRLFRVAGIDVFVHWSWLLIAYFEIVYRPETVLPYTSIAWSVVEYLSVFGIVLLHEFGHALACRQVGGLADRIVLWPLGGVAYVQPPPRPGALLWSIAAGPLVNVLLVPLTLGLVLVGMLLGWVEDWPDMQHYLFAIAAINVVLLLFNILPIYPLDGGQILRALLWFFIGPTRSLKAASVVGLAGAAGIVGLLLLWGWNWWYGILAAFIGWRSWIGFQQARMLEKVQSLPRNPDFACPSCGAAPPLGEWWACDECGCRFDTFVAAAECPECGKQHPDTMCVECHQRWPIAQWCPQVKLASRSEEDVRI